MKQFNNLGCLSPVWKGTFLPTPPTPAMLFFSCWAPAERPATCRVSCFSTLILPVFFQLWYSAKHAPANDPTDDWCPTTLVCNLKSWIKPSGIFEEILCFFLRLYFGFYKDESTSLATKCFFNWHTAPCLLNDWFDYKLLRLCGLFFISFIAGMNTGTGKQLSRKSFSLGMFSTKCHRTLSDDTRRYSDETKWCEQSYFKAATHQSKLQLPEKPSPPLTLSLPSFSTSSTCSFTALNFTKHSCEADLTCNYRAASVYLLQTPWTSGH